ncbi:MAG: hypothetical protein PHY29_02825 [Syntrophales bacterium]|nr:hypothetical protein [Syntrophales bacterium]
MSISHGIAAWFCGRTELLYVEGREPPTRDEAESMNRVERGL